MIAPFQPITFELSRPNSKPLCASFKTDASSRYFLFFLVGGVCADDNDDGVEKKTRDDAAIGSIDRRHRRLETVLPHGRR